MTASKHTLEALYEKALSIASDFNEYLYELRRSIEAMKDE